MVYRSPGWPPTRLSQLIETYQIRSVVNLCNPNEMTPGAWDAERRAVEGAGAAFHAVPLPNSVQVDPQSWAPHLELMSNPDSYPMLVHCQHGITRTGMFLTAYDVIHRHKTADESLAVQPKFGHDRAAVHVHAFGKNFEQFVRDNPARFASKPLETPAMTAGAPRISLCIPHWQAKLFMTLCLRSIRRHSRQYDLEVIVVDNGSRDESLDYLRSLDWIRLIERPEETHTNWPKNVFTAWDRGLQAATGDFYVTMHSDVFVKSDGWLDPFLRELSRGANVAAAGSWKLELEHPLYAWQKRVVGYGYGKAKSLLGVGKQTHWQHHHFPRDYCAMYRRQVLVDRKLTFRVTSGSLGGGFTIARQSGTPAMRRRSFRSTKWPAASITSRMARRRSHRKNG